MPFIPLYIEELGAPKSQIELFSGLAISVTAFAAAIIAPVWGNLADQKGRRLMMIRAAAGMTVTMGSLAFVPNVYWLLIMRFFTGILSGLYSKCDSIDCFSSPERKEWLGTRNISNRSYRRKLDRAFYGWCFSTVVWYEECIYHHRGSFFLITLLLTIFLVQEDFAPVEKGTFYLSKKFLDKSKPTTIDWLIYYFIDPATWCNKYQSNFDFIYP